MRVLFVAMLLSLGCSGRSTEASGPPLSQCDCGGEFFLDLREVPVPSARYAFDVHSWRYSIRALVVGEVASISCVGDEMVSRIRTRSTVLGRSRPGWELYMGRCDTQDMCRYPPIGMSILVPIWKNSAVDSRPEAVAEGGCPVWEREGSGRASELTRELRVIDAGARDILRRQDSARTREIRTALLGSETWQVAMAQLVEPSSRDYLDALALITDETPVDDVAMNLWTRDCQPQTASTVGEMIVFAMMVRFGTSHCDYSPAWGIQEGSECQRSWAAIAWAATTHEVPGERAHQGPEPLAE